jgi:MoaA/NifB/PqqE/SkfB family radical SAM enzyme
MAWLDFASRLLPRRGWIQVEVTSYCNAACRYCPHTVYRDSWQNRQLSQAAFQLLLPELRRKQMVYLQGWGEPFLHPEFFSLVALAKQTGCRVGTTTNGMCLDIRNIYSLVTSGLDVIAFSLAGLGERNDTARCGTSFQKVLDTIEHLNRVKAQFGSARPEINLAYLLLRSGLPDLENLPRALWGLGLSQVVISTLDFVPTRELAGEILPASEAEEAELRLLLEEVVRLGRHYSLEIHYSLRPVRQRPLICPERVDRALVISADGEVSPCVFTNLPVSGVNYLADGEEIPYRHLVFGKIKEQSLEAIWRQPAYANFRRSFYTGKLALPCRQCRKL